MKEYNKPQVKVQHIALEYAFLNGGSNVKTGGTTKDEYTNTDITFGKQNSLWDSDNSWDEEE